MSKFAPRGAPDRKQLEELARSGATLREIGLALDRSIATVRYWLRRWQIARPDARRSRIDLATAPREVLRDCRRHGPALFRLDSRGTYRCIRCSQQQVADRRRRVKRILVEEAGGRCAECGYDTCYAALQFHHVDPSAKAFALSHEGATRGIERARAEARKCVLLCANCHAEVEALAACFRLPGVDSNHQELINSQSCCRYITGERRCRA